MKAAQVGATEAGNCFIGFVMHQAPGPMLAVQPTVELAKTKLASADRPADRGEPGTAGTGEAGAFARRWQHDVIEGIRWRHLDHDRSELGGRAAIDPGALHFPRRGRCLSRLGG